jgi:tetratricopeptide (TPR) repeat protein
MRAAQAKDAYRVYLDEKPGYAASTAFFLDAADLLFEKSQPELALRVLSNLAEMDLENRQILRILGYRLLQAGQPAAAIAIFRKVLELAPEEPQSWRDLGLALAANRQHQQAAETLYEVAARPWDGRFPEIELITLADLNAIVAMGGGELDLARMDARLLRNLPLDLRAVLTWDADNTDIDLWVTDPNGERCYYGHRFTRQGGRMSQDFTGGYGPEEFSLRRALPGRYKVEAQFYGHRQQIVAGATTLQVRLTTRFGTPAAEEKLITLRLAGQSEVVYVGEFDVR